MNKEPTGKPAGQPVGVTNRTAGNKAVVPNGRPTAAPGAKPGAARAGKVTVTPNRPSAVGRGAARRNAKRKGGFRFSSLDIAMMLAGVVGVAILVIAVLTANKAPTTTPGGTSPAAQIPRNATPVPVGASAPDFSLPAADGQNYSLSQFKGKVVLLEFLATWCPHCQEDSKIFNQVSDAYKDKNVQFLGVNASPYGHDHTSAATIDDLKWFRDTYGTQYPLMFDKDYSVSNTYAVQYFPTVYVIDATGKINAMPDSDISVESVSALLDTALKAGQ
jgi:peroxiredoxin